MSPFPVINNLYLASLWLTVKICGSPRITGSWIPRSPMKGFWWHLHVGSSTRFAEVPTISFIERILDDDEQHDESEFSLEAVLSLARRSSTLISSSGIVWWKLIKITALEIVDRYARQEIAPHVISGLTTLWSPLVTFPLESAIIRIETSFSFIFLLLAIQVS